MVNKKNFKIISIITTVFVITTLIYLKGLITNATVADRPEFDIQFSSIPESAKVGEDIVVKGTLTPKPFEVDIENLDTEIIMVIDRNTDNKQGNGEVFNPLRNDMVGVIKDLSLTGNVKLGLIDYSNSANIFKEQYKSLFNITNKGKIADAIGSLSSEKQGYSNTGEALRKAAYLMESPESDGIDNKVIVLLSDGTPTARTVYSDGNPYIDITKEDYGNAQIQTSKNDYTKDIEYAKTIGNIIKEKGYTVYTIGYNVNENITGQDVLRDIHKSMTGYNLDNKENDIKNRFYIIENKKFTIQDIFKLIQKDILETYPINNIDMNINFTGNFSLNIGGNTINLSNINYKLVSQSNGKARYEAEPIAFEFVIKGNKEGYQQILDKVTITYPWQDSIEKVDINSELFITITPNELPSIVPKLISSDKIEIKKDEEITIKYQINPEDFIYNNVENSNLRDVIFLVDISKRNDSMLSEVAKGIHDKIMNISDLKDSNTKYSIITFNDNANILFDFSYTGTKDKGDYVNSINEVYLKNLVNIQSGYQRNIGKALKLAQQVFTTSRASASKNIVIISSNDVNYEKSDYANIVNNGYNIITLSLDSRDITSSLYNLHESLNGDAGNIMFVNNDSNAINNSLMTIIKEKLKAFSAIRPYEFKPTINLNLGNNFEPVSGIIRSSESGKNNIGIVDIPTITYNLTQNNNYHAESKIIEIRIKANNLSPGIYTLGNITDNKMTYKTLLNKDVSMTIKTPIIIVKDEIKDVNHGLYNGINNGQVSISENNNGTPFEIAQGSTVTFGANFTFSGSSTEFNLNVDNKFSVLNPNDIKIYKVLKDSSGNNTLQELDANNKSISTSEGNKFKVSINNITDSSTEILVVYQGKIIDSTAAGQALTNEIVFSSASKNTTITTPKQSNDSPILPDLF